MSFQKEIQRGYREGNVFAWTFGTQQPATHAPSPHALPPHTRAHLREVQPQYNPHNTQVVVVAVVICPPPNTTPITPRLSVVVVVVVIVL